MSILLIAAHTPGAGKTAIAAGLATLAAGFDADAGSGPAPVAVCKPLSPAGDRDPDAAYFARQFHGDIPVTTTTTAGNAADAALDAAAAAVRALAGNHPHTLVEIAHPEPAASGIASPWTLGLAERLAARLLAIFDYDAGLSAAAVSAAVAPLANALAGVIINRTPPYRTRQVAALRSELDAAGVPVLAAIPEDRPLLALTMSQLAQGLDGRWELEPSDGDAWVDRFLIGGNIMDSGAGYFGRYPKQAVITRAERPDIQMASLMPDGNTRCLVLTGGARPAEYIRVEAARRAVPVLLVDADTLATAAAVGALLPAAAAHHTDKATRMGHLLAERISVATLLP